jgi:hypothetical protein
MPKHNTKRCVILNRRRKAGFEDGRTAPRNNLFTAIHPIDEITGEMVIEVFRDVFMTLRQFPP